MAVHQLRMELASVPALLMFEENALEAGAKGTILFYHGLTASKEVQTKELSSLAQRGFLAVGLDNVGHGERREPDFTRRFSIGNPNVLNNLLDAVRATAKEIPQVIDELLRRGFADPEKIGVSGISMGGYITYAAVLADRRIKAAAPILGSPKWKTSDMESPHHHPDKFFPTALLAQNAGDDQNVPPKFAREFHKCLQPFYKEKPERLCYIEYPGAGHFMPEHDWNQLWENVLQWFEHFLV